MEDKLENFCTPPLPSLLCASEAANQLEGHSDIINIFCTFALEAQGITREEANYSKGYRKLGNNLNFNLDSDNGQTLDG